jgi:hypothetical protein
MGMVSFRNNLDDSRREIRASFVPVRRGYKLRLAPGMDDLLARWRELKKSEIEDIFSE